jgi:hypothetical protein
MKDLVFVFLAGLFFLSRGYNIWPKRTVLACGPDRKARLLRFGGYWLLAMSILGMFLRILGVR